VAAGIRADIVALYPVPRTAGAIQIDAALIIPRDDVARGGGRAADQVPAGIVKPDAVGGIAQGRHAGDACADPVALNRVAAAIMQVNARAAVGGDDIAVRRIRAADDIARGALNQHAAHARGGPAVALADGARPVGADIIALNDIRAAGRLNGKAGAVKAIDNQPADRAPPRRHVETIAAGAGIGAVKFDQRGAPVAGL